MLEEFQRTEAFIHFQRGLVLERANRLQEAVEEYRRAIASNPYFREAHNALGFYYQRYGLLAKAVEEFRIVASIQNDFLSYFNLGYVLLELERSDEALETFERCLRLEPDNPATHYEISSIHFAHKRYEQALHQLRVPLEQYAEDWEVHFLAGRCYLHLAQFDRANASLSRALQLAPRPAAQAQVLERMSSVERYREVGSIKTVKDRLYAEHGVVYLGSAQDDGVRLREMRDYHFTYPDIAVTLRRFLVLAEGCQWHFTCVVGLDRLAQPLAAALATLLNLPLCRNEALQPTDLPLLVIAVGREAELLNLAIERVPGEALTFCLGLNWLRHSALLPDISGIIAQAGCSVPWEGEMRRLRADGCAPAQLDACVAQAAEQIVIAMREVPAETQHARHVQYYAKRHRYVRFADVFDDMSLLDDVELLVG